MLEQKEFDEIVFKVIETVLLRMPEVIGKLMQEQAMINKLNRKFYDKNPEFKDKMHLMASVIEKIESENTTLDYEEILDKAVPELKKRLKILDSCDIGTKLDRKLLDLNVDKLDSNGVM